MRAQRKPDDAAITGLVDGGVGGGGGGGAQGFKLSSQGKALVAAAQKLGVSPLDLAQLMSFETGGTFSPSIWGGTKNKYMGLIQFGGPERQQYEANPRQSFEEQVQGPVVGFLQDRAKLRGLSTQGMSAAEMYRLVNPGYGDAAFNRDSGARGDRSIALRRFFGGKAENVGYDAAAAGADAAQAFEAAQKEAEQTAKQLAAARDLLATKEAAFEIANAIGPLEKLSLEFDNERTRRMQEYVDKLSGAKSDEERLLLVQSQAFDIRKAEIDAQEKMKAITADQLDLERERATLLADSMARMEEMSTRSSIGTGAQQGIQAYVDSVGNLRDAVGQLTTNAIGGLEDSLTSLATTGAGNFKAFAASVLKDTTRMIIRQLVLKSIMQIIGGIGGSATAKSFEMPGAAFIPSGGYAFAPSALGNVFAANGIQPFAQGGIVSRPTLFPFAKGIGLMGEAGPEAIMPLRRGADGKLGVAGGGGSTTINVSVDAKGSSVQGDGQQGAALARAIAGAVQTEMVKQKRPGGLLAS
jgi:lambda family phage tail tape measure protein